MRKLFYFVTVIALVVATYFYLDRKTSEESINKNQTKVSSRSLFMGKRGQLIPSDKVNENGKEIFVCNEELEKLNAVSFEDDIDEILKYLMPSSFSNSSCRKEFSRVDEVLATCFGDKKRKDLCLYNLIFLRSELRSKLINSPETAEELADKILNEFSKKSPDFKLLAKYSDKLLDLNPSPAVQKLWGMSRLFALDKIKDFNKELSDEILRRLDSSILNEKEMRDFSMILKNGLNPEKLANGYRDLIAQDNKDSSAHEMLGWALWQQNKKSEAIAELEKAIKLSPNDDWLREMYNRVILKDTNKETYKGRLKLGFDFKDLFN